MVKRKRKTTTRVEYYQIAKKLKIEGRSKMNKAQLIKAIASKRRKKIPAIHFPDGWYNIKLGRKRNFGMKWKKRERAYLHYWRKRGLVANHDRDHIFSTYDKTKHIYLTHSRFYALKIISRIPARDTISDL